MAGNIKLPKSSIKVESSIQTFLILGMNEEIEIWQTFLCKDFFLKFFL